MSVPKRKRHTGRPKTSSMPIISNARTLPKSADPRTGLYAGPYLIASGASALTSTPKATMRKSGNYSQTNSAKERLSSISNLPSMSPSKKSSGRGCSRDVHDGGLLQTCRSQCRDMADVLRTSLTTSTSTTTTTALTLPTSCRPTWSPKAF